MDTCCINYSDIRVMTIQIGMYMPMHKSTHSDSGRIPESPELRLSLTAIFGTRIIAIP